jgi:hypothetical protein
LFEGKRYEEILFLDWLTDAHNYPEIMDFDLDPLQVEDIADYILTLRSDDYAGAMDW